MFTQRGWTNKVITLAYYPDGRQEQLLRDHGAMISWQADLLHMMSYDQGGSHHSTLEYGKKSADQGKRILPARQLTMGVPFYGRHSRSGDWTTYEDLVQRYWPLDFAKDAVDAPDKGAVEAAKNDKNIMKDWGYIWVDVKIMGKAVVARAFLGRASNLLSRPPTPLRSLALLVVSPTHALLGFRVPF
eukprot:s605_g12.t1